jgi:hypothetical protein
MSEPDWIAWPLVCFTDASRRVYSSCENSQFIVTAVASRGNFSLLHSIICSVFTLRWSGWRETGRYWMKYVTYNFILSLIFLSSNFSKCSLFLKLIISLPFSLLQFFFLSFFFLSFFLRFFFLSFFLSSFLRLTQFKIISKLRKITEFFVM